MKACTYCGKEYADEASACLVDGQPLRSLTTLPPPPREEEKHSGLGIASFAISILVGCLLLALFVVANFLNAGRLQHGQNYPGQVYIGFVAIFLWAVDVLAAGLGIAAICQAGRKRVFGVLGLVFSSGTLLGSVALVVVGLIYLTRL